MRLRRVDAAPWSPRRLAKFEPASVRFRVVARVLVSLHVAYWLRTPETYGSTATRWPAHIETTLQTLGQLQLLVPRWRQRSSRFRIDRDRVGSGWSAADRPLSERASRVNQGCPVIPQDHASRSRGRPQCLPARARVVPTANKLFPLHLRARRWGDRRSICHSSPWLVADPI